MANQKRFPRALKNWLTLDSNRTLIWHCLLGGTTGTYIVRLLVAVAFWMIACHAFLTGCRLPGAGFGQSLSTLEAFVKHCDLIANCLVHCEGLSSGREIATLQKFSLPMKRGGAVFAAEWQWMFMEEIVRQQLKGGGKNTIFIMSKYNYSDPHMRMVVDRP